MAEATVQVPESWVAVFHRGSLPGHPGNPGTDQVTEWPRSSAGTAFMPMSGRFVVRGASGDEAHEDGFLLVDADGHPYWQAGQPE